MVVVVVTYDCNFATKLVLDLALFDRLRSFLLDDLEKLLDSHLAGTVELRLLFTCLQVRQRFQREPRSLYLEW